MLTTTSGNAGPLPRAVAGEIVELAHELRTPLNSVIGLSAVLGRGIHGPLNAKQAEYVGQIEAGGRHLLALVNDLLDLARAEAGKLDVPLTEVPVGDVVAEAVAMVRQQALDKAIVIRSGQEPDLPRVLADPLRLRQVLLNLLANAITFSDSGQDIGVHAHAGRGTVSIDVWDTGIGIAAEDLERIFEPFEQGADSSLRGRTGTGLGLPLSRRLTELQGGRLTVRSARGYGSVFTATFPAVTAERRLSAVPSPDRRGDDR